MGRGIGELLTSTHVPHHLVWCYPIWNEFQQLQGDSLAARGRAMLQEELVTAGMAELIELAFRGLLAGLFSLADEDTFCASLRAWAAGTDTITLSAIRMRKTRKMCSDVSLGAS